MPFEKIENLTCALSLCRVTYMNIVTVQHYRYESYYHTTLFYKNLFETMVGMKLDQTHHIVSDRFRSIEPNKKLSKSSCQTTACYTCKLLIDER
jgi:uncharacterized metal-binding protein